jgi:CelD/BcsL family acetyltransferase involved in cellulose biosynthesis
LLHVDVATTLQQLQGLARTWHELYAHSGCRLPFLHLSWIENWWEIFGRSTRFVHNELMVLTVHDRNHLIGVLPLYRSTYGLGSTMGFRYVRPLGSDPNLTEVRTALILPGKETVALEAIGRHFAEHLSSWDLLNWSSFPDRVAPSPLLPGRPVSTARHPPVEMFLVNLPGSWEAFVAPLTRNTKEAIRRAHNALKRDGLDAEFQVVSAPEEILELLPQFLDLHGRRADLAGAVNHPNVFRPDHHQEFLAAIVESMGASGMVRLFTLKVAGRIVAARLAFIVKDTLYLYYSGFDPSYGKYSVSTRLVVESIKWAIQSGIATINLSSGRDRSKTRWGPEVVCYRNYSHVGPRWRSRAAVALINKVLSVSNHTHTPQTHTLHPGAGPDHAECQRG